jgi:hypothetical protein
MAKIIEIYTKAGTALQYRTRAEFTRFFDGWQLLDPGVSLPHHWHPDNTEDIDNISAAEAACYGAVARKP